MKHRAKGSKIKYEHKMIQGLRQFLEEKSAPLDFTESNQYFAGDKAITSGILKSRSL